MLSRFTAIIQARNGSTRLPKKVMADLSGKPLLEFMINRVKRAKNINEIIIATTKKKEDDEIETLANKLDVKVFRGSSDNVLLRFKNASLITDSEHIVRLTADCPLIDPDIIDQAINIYKNKNVGYLCNNYPPTFPDGLDVEIFKKELLEESILACDDKLNKEHVTPWIREKSKYRKFTFKSNIDYSEKRWTVDEEEDLKVIKKIVAHFNGCSNFSWLDVLKLNEKSPLIFRINSKIKRNEGFDMNSGQKLYKRAKKIIPGGNMLLSKRPEMFLPNTWPSYFSKSKGCKVWDLDDNEYLDMSIMGIGTNILGYGCSEVDSAVNQTIKKGNMSTLNCPEEVYLAEKLISIHPWADMARFARSGGEANAIAIRIARAKTGKDKIAICGYHGWHDWYLATNLENNTQLNEHLLPGLEPIGVPKSLKGSVIPFAYNNFNQLEEIVKNNEIAAIKMEVERSIPPRKGFLENVRKLCNKKGIILIFDECTSGFRETFGGLHLKYGINPDMAMFGKALGNGYAITAVIGKKEIMDSTQNTFISSTFWTERIGPTAALKTLEIMEKNKSWIDITEKGNFFKNQLFNLGKKYNLNLKFSGLNSLTTFILDSKNDIKYKTLITQEMLKKGFLASNSFYVSTAHSKKIISKYVTELEEVFYKIKQCEDEEIDINDLLDNECCHSGFKRLN